MMPRPAARIALTAALLFLSVSARAASDTVTVILTATIKANTCSLADSAPTVELPAVSLSDFSASRGTESGDRKVAIRLTDCDPGTTGVKVTAKGVPDDADYRAFKNSAAGDEAAAGVGLYFYARDGITRFYPDGSVSDSVPLSAGQNNTLIFSAGYVSTQKNVTPGYFHSVVNLEFDYQ